MDKAKRFRALRDNASIGSAEKTIAENMGLPPGSVRLSLPSKGGKFRKARVDSTVANLRASWSK